MYTDQMHTRSIPYWACLLWISLIYLSLLVYRSRLDLISLATGDIHQYIVMANEISSTGLQASSFTHGPLYPAFGSLFIAAGIAANPFPLISIGLVSSSLSWLILEINQLNLARAGHLLAAVAIAILTDPATKFFIEGASNSTTAATIFCLTALALSSRLNTLKIVFSAALLGLCLGTRYIDVALLFPLLICCLVRMRSFLVSEGKRSNKIKFALIVATTLIIASLLSTLHIQQSVLGSLGKTPYDNKVPAISRIKESSTTESPASQLSDRDFTKILPRSYQVLIDQSAYIHEYERFGQKTLLQKMPYILLLPTGISLLWSRHRKLRFLLASITISFLIWMCFYSTGWAFTSHDIYYGCLRYVSGWSLLIGIISLYAFSFKKKWQLFPSVVTAGAIVATIYMYKLWDKATSSSTTFRLDSNQSVYNSHFDYSSKSDRNQLGIPHGLDYTRKILVNSSNDNRFARVELETPSSLDNYFPESITLKSSGKKLTDASLSRENHTWVIKLREPVNNLQININHGANTDRKDFKLFSVSTFRF